MRPSNDRLTRTVVAVALAVLLPLAALALASAGPSAASSRARPERRWSLARSAAALSTGDPGTALAAVNAWRQLSGVPALRLDDRMTQAAQAHASYYQQNALNQAAFANGIHREIAGFPGFVGVTGADRARAFGYPAAEAGDPWSHYDENIATAGGSATVVDRVESLIGAVYHRDNFLTIAYRDMGYGAAVGSNGFAMYNFDLAATGVPLVAQTVPFPPDGLTGVPQAWLDTEDPDPLPPDAPSRDVGYVVSLHLPPPWGAYTLSAASLVDARGAPVDVYVSQPGRTGLDTFPFLVPKRYLEANTCFTAHLAGTRGTLAFDRTWRFGTGSAPSCTAIGSGGATPTPTRTPTATPCPTRGPPAAVTPRPTSLARVHLGLVPRSTACL